MMIDENYKQFLKSIKKDIEFFIALAVKDSVSRKIALYVYQHEIKDSTILPINLTNEELAKKLNIAETTLRAGLSRAKSAGLLTITGGGRTRLISFNPEQITKVKNSLLLGD